MKRKFLEKDNGTATLEFAMLAPVFFALLFSVFEAGMYFYSVSVVEEAVSRASRVIMTGQALEADDEQNPSCSSEKDCFYEEVCDVVSVFGGCQSRLSIDVTRFDSWDDLNNDLSEAACVNSEGYDYSNQAFNRGVQRDIVRVRVCYLMNMVNPALGLNLAQTEDGKRALITTHVFRNEPFGGAGGNDESN
ncbi:MAG: pilus assembly protein [Aquisalinus sp.]|nr:pilus assembly protein [Aquisalinus sp.]